MGGPSLPIYSRRYYYAHHDKRIEDHRRTRRKDPEKTRRVWEEHNRKHPIFRKFYLRNYMWLRRNGLPTRLIVHDPKDLRTHNVMVLRDVDEYLEVISIPKK